MYYYIKIEIIYHTNIIYKKLHAIYILIYVIINLYVDSLGSHLYVSAEGEFDIYEGNKFQRSFKEGVAFGEIALLYNTKRLRSISGKQ